MDDHLVLWLQKGLVDASAGLAIFDPDEHLRWANPWFEQAYNIDVSEGHTWESLMRRCHATRRGVLIETPDIDGWLGRVRTKFRQSPVRAFQSDLVDGRWVWVVETLQANGWLSMVVSDVSPLKATEAALRDARDEAVRVSTKDSLTDLHNRRFIMEHLRELLAGSKAMRWPVALAVLDIDHFKHINDESGHDVGDSVLRHFADQLRHELRPKDAIGRIGGEEFLMVLPNTDLDGATRALGRVRRLIAESIAQSHRPIPNYTFSAGIALATADDSADTLFRRADQALYRAKRSGRNRDSAENSRSMRL